MRCIGTVGLALGGLGLILVVLCWTGVTRHLSWQGTSTLRPPWSLTTKAIAPAHPGNEDHLSEAVHLKQQLASLQALLVSDCFFFPKAGGHLKFWSHSLIEMGVCHILNYLNSWQVLSLMHKGTFKFQPLIFRGYVSFRKGTCNPHLPVPFIFGTFGSQASLYFR